MSGNDEKTLAIASLVLAILALLGCWIPLLNLVSFLLAIIGLILGIVGIKQKQGGLAIAGTTISTIALLVIMGMYFLFGKFLDKSVQNFTDNLNIDGMDIVEWTYDESTASGIVTGKVVNNSDQVVDYPMVIFNAYERGQRDSTGTCFDVMYGEFAPGNTWEFSAACQLETAPARVEPMGVTSFIPATTFGDPLPEITTPNVTQTSEKTEITTAGPEETTTTNSQETATTSSPSPTPAASASPSPAASASPAASPTDTLSEE